ncbi:MAG: hypothetical protein LAT83_08390 [Kiritimatiellae bacterium]|nr:hypothetical protein [Kiritimatiellia bacterium]
MKPNNFDTTLRNFPEPGQGVHAHILRAVHAGLRQHLTDRVIAERITRAMPRPPRSNEIEEALAAAKFSRKKKNTVSRNTSLSRYPGIATRPKSTAQPDKSKILENIWELEKKAGGQLPLNQLRKRSPIPLGDLNDPHEQRANAMNILETLHGPEAKLYIGSKYDTGPDYVGSRDACIDALNLGPRPLWIPNPLTGGFALNKQGKLSNRCDNTVALYPYLLFEIDHKEIRIETQAALLLQFIRVGVPIRSITYSGGKSLHALIEVGLKTRADWDKIVIHKLKPRLVRYGADNATFNPARLSRLPGWNRDGNLQSLVWLAPKGWRP